MTNIACAFLSLLFSLTPLVSPAGEVFVKERTADDLYGRGVHAYHAKDYDAAKKLLNEVQQLGSTDPRPYFFLGLTLLKLEQKRDADDAFRKAAFLEREGRTARDYGVSSALTRVQGVDRVYLERFRAEARIGAADAAERDHTNRFGNQPAPTNVKARRDVAAAGTNETWQTAVKYSPVVLRPARLVFGEAKFGARSIDPFANKIIGAVATPESPAPPKTNDTSIPTPVVTQPTTPTPAAVQFDDDADPFD